MKTTYYSFMTSQEHKESAHHKKLRMLIEEKQLEERWPIASCSLDYENPFQLVVATVLSAQTTDKRVNIVTKDLFATYPTPQLLAQADITDVENIIRTLGFYHVKAAHIVALSQTLVEKFNSIVPQTMEELTQLPGVGRKTANVVLGDAFHKPGFPVDTHVMRVSGRLQWTDQWNAKHPDPVKIEKQITPVFPGEKWASLSHRLIYLGREICHPRNPACYQCPLSATCPFALHKQNANH